MKSKLKKAVMPFILMLIFNLGIYYLTNGENFGGGLSPHVGILFISGLLFGVYGAIGSVIGNFLCDLIRGYGTISALLSLIIGFGVSYLSYKLWYADFYEKLEVTKPKLSNTHQVIKFLLIVVFCGVLYSLLTEKLSYLIYPGTIHINSIIGFRYFINFINSSFLFGVIGIWVSKRINFIQIPESSKKTVNPKLYKIIGILLVIFTLIILISDKLLILNNNIVIFEIVLIIIPLFVYLMKPNVKPQRYENSISEEVMSIFLLSTLFIIAMGILFSFDYKLIEIVNGFLPLDSTEIVVSIMAFMDILLILFLIPSLMVLKYIEMKVIQPILSFSKIKGFIKENERIESEGLLNIYSEYISEDNEIGILAKSYTDLIKHNNYYIENIQVIEGEKERIKAELDIARKIQQSNLPVEAIENDDFIVYGYSKAAKEVGGDFFDYYMIDEDNLVIVIGDASGKGVPAALLATITQIIIKQVVQRETDPSKILYSLNNQLCENNTTSMFITLWLGIYNKKTKKIIYSNAGHNPPLMKENDEFKLLNIDTGIVLGIMEDFEFVKDTINFSKELILYTDGITDANNKNNEMYGENRLINFFNKFKSENDPIKPLLKDINDFTKDMQQFDDMTILYLKDKK